MNNETPYVIQLMNSSIDDNEALRIETAALISSVTTQAASTAAQSVLADKVLPQGKITTSAPKKAKAPVVIETDAFTSEDKFFVRPNGDKYFTRTWGEHSDVLALREARTGSYYTMFYGSPGCGKTALVEAAFGHELHTVLGSGDTEVSDLVGGYVQLPGEGFKWVDGPLVRAAEAGEVFFIDEIGLIDPKVLSIVYGLMDGRKEYTVTANPDRGTVKAHEGFFVVAATNPNAPGVRLSEALLSRFVMQTELTTDWGLARKLGAPTTLVTCAQNLARKVQTGEVGWAPQMRELLAFRDLSKTFGTKFAIANLLACAPELDRPVVADVFTRAFGEDCRPAKI